MFKTYRGCPLWALKFQKKCSGAYDKKTRWTLSDASEFSEKCSDVFDKNIKTSCGSDLDENSQLNREEWSINAHWLDTRYAPKVLHFSVFQCKIFSVSSTKDRL